MQVRQKLGDITQIRAGYTFRERPEHRVNGNVHLVQASDLEKWIVLDHPEYLPKINNPAPKHALLQQNDILFTARGRFHATVVASKDIPIIASSSLYILSLHGSKYRSQFIAMYMNSPDAQRFFYKYGYGTNIQSLLSSTIAELPLPNLSIDHQGELLKFYNNMMEQEEKLERKQELLEQIFTATLSEAFKGALA